jgi:hypothetical protein
MSKVTLSFMCERSGLGGGEDGVGSSEVIGIADTGQGISATIAMVAVTTSRLVKRRGELSSEGDIMGSV